MAIDEAAAEATGCLKFFARTLRQAHAAHAAASACVSGYVPTPRDCEHVAGVARAIGELARAIEHLRSAGERRASAHAGEPGRAP